MKTKYIVGVLLIIVGAALTITGYLKLSSMAGPVRHALPGFADRYMWVLCAGVVAAVVGITLVVFYAMQERD